MTEKRLEFCLTCGKEKGIVDLKTGTWLKFYGSWNYCHCPRKLIPLGRLPFSSLEFICRHRCTDSYPIFSLANKGKAAKQEVLQQETKPMRKWTVYARSLLQQGNKEDGTQEIWANVSVLLEAVDFEKCHETFSELMDGWDVTSIIEEADKE